MIRALLYWADPLEYVGIFRDAYGEPLDVIMYELEESRLGSLLNR